ncbi:MAG: hypothetical protein IPP40_15630 [bacterium]|nr:hypothetical protein [bacterium]
MRIAYNNLLSLLLLSGLLCPLVSFGQDSLNVQSIGSYWSFWDTESNGDFGFDTDVQGDYAFLCNIRAG